MPVFDFVIGAQESAFHFGRFGHVAATDDVVFSRIAWRVLPLLMVAWLFAYIDRVNVGFAKLQMAAELLTWAANWLKIIGRTLWVVADGAYAKRVFLSAAAAARVTVVSRLSSL